MNLFYPYRISKQSLYTLCPKKKKIGERLKSRSTQLICLRREYYISTILIVFFFIKCFRGVLFLILGALLVHEERIY